MVQHLMSIDDVSTLVDGLDHPEGVTWGPDGYVYAGGEAGQIYRVSLDGQLEQVGTTGGFILGLCLDGDRNVYACDTRNFAVMRIAPDRSVSTYSGGTQDHRMFNPNYPVFDRHGNLWVTDSGHWQQNDGCLMRIKPGGETAIVNTTLREFPNGLALSPDEKYLYVVLSLVPGVAKIPVYADGSVGEPEQVVTLPQTVPDGLAFDSQGNLYISCYTPDVIYRLAPDGELAIVVEDWQSTQMSSPTNIAFCGSDLSTLVIASLSRWHLAQVKMPVPGAPLHYPHI